MSHADRLRRLARRVATRSPCRLHHQQPRFVFLRRVVPSLDCYGRAPDAVTATGVWSRESVQPVETFQQERDNK